MYNSFLPYQQYQQRQQLIRVNGIDGARAYQMPPNSTVALFDANNDLMYIKCTDGAGFATTRVFSFIEQKETQTPTASEFVTRKEFEELKEVLKNGKQSVSEQ